MKKNIILEDINRMKLLMKYDTKNTLTENVIIAETAFKSALEVIGKEVIRDEGAVLRSLETAAKDGTLDMKNLVLQDGTRLTKLSDVLDALKAGTLGPSGTGSVAKSLFMKGSTAEVRAAGADAITSMGKFSKEFGNLSREQIVDKLMATGKYSREDCELLADTYLKKKGIKPKIEPDPNPVRPEDPIPTDPTWKERFKKWAKTKWGKRILVAGSLLAAYMLWKKMTEEDDIPICLKNYVDNEKEFETYLNDGFVKITIDGSVYQIYPDGKVTVVFAGGGTAEGEWTEEGENVIANIRGVKKVIPCGGEGDDDEGGDEGGGGGGGGGQGGYNDCPDFPLTQGCKSNKIKEIQGCIGATADGKYGPKTKSALESKGYSTTITKDVYDKIMKDCGKTNPDSETTTPNPEIGNINTID